MNPATVTQITESPGGAAGLDPALFAAFWVTQEDLAWQDQAICAQVDPDLFFPEKGGGVRIPKRICRGCPVRDECLDFAFENDLHHGIWGGTSEQERRRMRREVA